MDAERLFRIDLQNWTIRVLAPTALRSIGLHHVAAPLATLPTWETHRRGDPASAHLTFCKAAYYAADHLNNAEWQTRTLRTRSDGSTTDEHRRQRPPSPTADIHQLADLLGPAYFTHAGFRPDQMPRHSNDDSAPTRAAFHAYAAAALCHQITHRRNTTLNLSDALTHPTYRTFRHRLDNADLGTDTDQDHLR